MTTAARPRLLPLEWLLLGLLALVLLHLGLGLRIGRRPPASPAVTATTTGSATTTGTATATSTSTTGGP